MMHDDAPLPHDDDDDDGMMMMMVIIIVTIRDRAEREQDDYAFLQ
jgi:hypothetical protein